MRTIRVGQLNLCRTNAAWQQRADLEKALRLCDFLILNEREGKTAPTVVDDVLDEHPEWGAYIPRGAAGAVAVLHHRDAVAKTGRGISRMTHKGVRGVTPNRYDNRRRFQLAGWGWLCLIGTHAVNGYTKPWKFPTTIGLRRTLSAIHWRTTARVTRWATRWNTATVLVGDTNGGLEASGPAFMPGPVLADLYDFDVAHGFDHVLVAKPRKGQRRRAEHGRRRTFAVHSDHPLVVQEVRLF